MTYPGNQSLASDVQQRIRSTFEHTLGLAEKGSRQEALLGCDFVLRMDPLFAPARRLQERLEATSGPLAVEDLRGMEAPAEQRDRPSRDSSTFPAPSPAGPRPAASAGPAAAHDALWSDLDGLASELPELPDPHAARGPAALRAEFESLLAERRFQELQMRAREEAGAVTGDLELQRLEKLAHERLEAGPYVSKFLLSAREAMRAGNTVDGNRLLDKARALDPTHPGIAELSPPGGAAPPAPPAPPAIDAPAGRGSSGPSGSPAAAFSAAALAPGSAAPSLVPPPPAALRAQPGMPQTSQASQASQTPPSAPQPPFPTTAPSNADTESERRIQQLLDEGQAALDGGDPQAAIDAWSRIFLIDIDHQEAAHRIDRARRMKAERDRQVEETFHDGMSQLEAGEADGAREAFQRVLELQPGHLQAREYLQQLEDGNVPAVAGAGRTGAARSHSSLTGSMPVARPAPADPGSAATFASAGGAARASTAAMTAMPAMTADGAPLPPLAPGLAPGAGAPDLAADHDLQEEILVPPDVSQAARSQDARHESRSASVAHAGRARRLFLVVGSAVLLLALAVGWFLYQKREQWFPNSRTEEPAPAPAPNPIPRATKLHGAGKTALALAQLSRVPPGDLHYKEAQALIAKWQAEQAQAGPGAEGASSPAPGSQQGGGPGAAPVAGTGGAPGVAAGVAGSDAERRQALIENARQAYQEGAFLLAAQRYAAAGRLGKLDAGDAGQLGAAKQKLLPLQRQIDLFLNREWEFALPDLWKIHQADPGNRDVTRMIVDSYYDLGVRDLQHNEVAKAEQKFTEARTLAPDDPDVKRQLAFAQTYQARGPDLLYQIYVKYLPIR
jgi:tetratricopeptide (TPR) repeat protein